MEEFRLDGLTVKEHLLILAEDGNRKFTEGLHPGVEHVLGIRLPALRKLAARIAKADWERYLDTATGSIWKNACCKVWCWDASAPTRMWKSIFTV